MSLWQVLFKVRPHLPLGYRKTSVPRLKGPKDRNWVIAAARRKEIPKNRQRWRRALAAAAGMKAAAKSL